MRDHLKSLRIRLSVAGFLAIYVPLLVLVVVTLANQAWEEDIEASPDEFGADLLASSTGSAFSWQLLAITAAITAPIAAALSWWWSGRAIRPVAEAMLVQEQLVEETSHELRTPLAILTNNAEVLLGHPDPTIEEYRTGLTRSLTTAQGMTRTIEALLVDARGRARTIERQPTDLTHLVEHAVSSLQPIATDARVTVERPRSARITARVDAPSIERAVTNLIHNAIKVSPAGATVLVAVESREDDTVEIFVTDEGPGIDDADQEHVFERYWQGELSSGEGSGIGLDIVRHVAQAHGGDVRVESPVADDHGTRFVLALSR